jgi:hypothetical protein
MHSGRNLAAKAIEMLQRNLHYLKENISEKRLSQLAEELSNEAIPYRQFVDVISARYPQLLLAESTRRRKIREYESSNKANADYRKSELAETNKRGCFSIFLLQFVAVASISFIALKYLPFAPAPSGARPPFRAWTPVVVGFRFCHSLRGSEPSFQRAHAGRTQVQDGEAGGRLIDFELPLDAPPPYPWNKI